MARVVREYTEEPAATPVVYDRGRRMAFNPVSIAVSVIFLFVLVWAIFGGPIGEMFDGDGTRPTIDAPQVNTNK